MTRVETQPTATPPVPPSEPKKFWHRIRLRPRIGGCCGCLLLNIVALLIMVGVVMFALAGTGLVTVPFFSRWYRTPQPMRVVVPGSQTLEGSVESQIKKQSDSIIRNSNGSKTFSVVLREEELTRSFRDFIATSFREVKVEHAQVAIDPEAMEWYVRFSRGEHHPVITLRLQPVLLEGKITFRVRHAELGTFPIWHRLVEAMLNRALTDALAQVNKNVFAVSEVQSVTLKQGSVEVVGILKTPAQK